MGSFLLVYINAWSNGDSQRTLTNLVKWCGFLSLYSHLPSGTSNLYPWCCLCLQGLQSNTLDLWQFLRHITISRMSIMETAHFQYLQSWGYPLLLIGSDECMISCWTDWTFFHPLIKFFSIFGLIIMDKILKQKPIKASRLGCQFSMTVLALGGREVHFPINFFLLSFKNSNCSKSCPYPP